MSKDRSERDAAALQLATIIDKWRAEQEANRHLRAEVSSLQTQLQRERQRSARVERLANVLLERVDALFNQLPEEQQEAEIG